ncbi:MAG: hypothetical protein DRJ01_00285 [Bacteroidetes bacterium]|nr:MAG: hypothetical protein DRJ01_00285 [Bacteroidota bacterium]
MKNKFCLFIILLFIITPNVKGQRRSWKRTRYEAIAGIGVANFLGELGGSGKVGQGYYHDFQFSQSRPLFNVAMRYKIFELLAAKVGLSYGYLHGSDATTNNIYRHDRNLKFRSPIIELSSQLEFSIIKEPVKHRYSLRRSRKFNIRSLQINTYLFAGVAGFWFNPKGKDDGPDGDGKWHSLQPLGTEGQGLIETREKYHRVQMSIPLGIGFKYAISRKLSIGLEYGGRFTFTDYIDDVSTTYVDNAWLVQERGELAGRLANPGLEELNGYVYQAGDQRGNPNNNDYYMFTIVSLSYKLYTGRNGMPKF